MYYSIRIPQHFVSNRTIIKGQTFKIYHPILYYYIQLKSII